MKGTDGKETFELDDSKNILSLDKFLDESIKIWLYALTTAIKEGQGRQESLNVGLICQSIAANRVEGIADAKNLIHWKKQALPEKKDKHYDAVVRYNKEAAAYDEKFKDFKKVLEEAKIEDKKIIEARIGDFKVFEVMRAIEKSSTKTGKVII